MSVRRPHLSVRPLLESEAELVADYFVNTSVEDRERMALLRVPPREELLAVYRDACQTPDEDATSAYLAWLVDGLPIGFSSLKGIVRGESGGMHLHMWEPSVRGRGYGPVLFCLSVLEFQRRFELTRIVCEPRKTNPLPNGLLAKVGFRLEGSFVGASSELSAIAELNRWVIEPEVARRYLDEHGGFDAV